MLLDKGAYSLDFLNGDVLVSICKDLFSLVVSEHI